MLLNFAAIKIHMILILLPSKLQTSSLFCQKLKKKQNRREEKGDHGQIKKMEVLEPCEQKFPQSLGWQK